MSEIFVVELVLWKMGSSTPMMRYVLENTQDVKVAVDKFYNAEDKMKKSEIHIPSPECANQCLECRMLYTYGEP